MRGGRGDGGEQEDREHNRGKEGMERRGRQREGKNET